MANVLFCFFVQMLHNGDPNAENFFFSAKKQNGFNKRHHCLNLSKSRLVVKGNTLRRFSLKTQ